MTNPLLRKSVLASPSAAHGAPPSPRSLPRFLTGRTGGGTGGGPNPGCTDGSCLVRGTLALAS